MTAKRKGNILEDIVAMMHDVPGVVVEKRKKLRVVKSDRRRHREVDVLIKANVAGYDVRLVIGCKNEKTPVGVDAVDELFGILDEVGIPPQHGILVSTSGYTGGALDAAKRRGMKTLVFDGLSADRLGQEINAAIQTMVFILITQSSFSILPYVEERFTVGPFINATMDTVEEPTGVQLLSCMAWLWMNGKIPLTIGEHIISLTPERDEAKWHVMATVTATGFFASVPGTFTQSILKDAEAGQVTKVHISAKIEQIKGTLTLEPITSEDALSAAFQKQPLSLMMRIRVPRIVTDFGYWPPTEEAVQRAKALFDAGKRVTFDDFQSSNLAEAWGFRKAKADRG